MPWDVAEALALDAAEIARLQHLGPLLDKIEGVAQAAVADNFAGEWDGASGWAPLAESTQEDRVRRGYSAAHPILQRTGELASTIDYRHDLGADDAAVEIEPRADYAAFHQEGTSKMPARPFVALSERDQERIGEDIIAFLEGDALPP